MEALLLSLYQLRNKGLSQKALSEQLGISQRQLSRKLAIWQYEGILTYESFKGRGKHTLIHWHTDIEKVYYQQIKSQFNNDQLDEVLQYLTWDWSSIYRQKLFKKVNNRLGYNVTKDNKEKLTITKKHKLFSIHPLEALDAKSASVVMSVFDRLFSIDQNNQITYRLCHYYELSTHYVDIYLRPNIQFHDGTILHSDDVKRCLISAQQHQHTMDMLAPIDAIETLSPLTLRIHFKKCPHIIALLGSVTLSIYKETPMGILGTGPYFIKHHNDFSTILKRFDHYYGMRAFIDTIEMIYVKDANQTLIGNPNNPLKTIERSLGFYYLCKNPQSTLNIEQARFVRDVLYQHFRYEMNQHFKKNLDSPKCLNQSRYISKIRRNPGFNRPVIIDNIGVNQLRPQILTNLLTSYGIPCKIRCIDFEDFMNRNVSFTGDYCCFGEFLDEPETLTYYSFIFNRYSSIYPFTSQYSWFEQFKSTYMATDFTQWPKLNRLMDRYLFRNGILVPLFNEHVMLQYESHLMGIKLNAMGFVDFQDIWVKD